MSIKKIRPYQKKLDEDIVSAWSAGHQNVMAQSATGSGKTFLFTGIIAREPGYTCAIAHRQELVGQMSLALNHRGVQHYIIAPDNVVRATIAEHVRSHGVSHYTPNCRHAVAGVDTLISRRESLSSWGKRVALWVIDEAHHCLTQNKWGKAVDLFPNARGLMVTATPGRADGKGLGRHADGLADVLILGPPMRQLITEGYLTDYRIFAPPCNIQLDGVKVSSSTGDYSQPQLVARVRESRVVGDVVEHYLKIAPGKLGITFATDVQTATDIARAFCAAGVPAEMICAKTPDAVRQEAARRLARGDLKELVNVDIFGEGYDCPAIEVVSLARPTESRNLHDQQIGRGLRPLPGKKFAWVIDHVNNIVYPDGQIHHGLPDGFREWTLDARDKRASTKDPNVIPMRVCTACTGVYEATHKACPYCGAERVIAQRSGPEFVDGDLLELDMSVLSALRGEVARVDSSPESVRDRMLHAGAPIPAAYGAAKQHRLRQEAQVVLREAIALWAGVQRFYGRSDSESYKRFYWRFGLDVLSAQALGRTEAEKLTVEINGELLR